MKQIEISPQYLEKLEKKLGRGFANANLYFDVTKAYKIYFTPQEFEQVKEKIKFFHKLNLEDALNPLEIISTNYRKQGFSMINFPSLDFRYLKPFTLQKRLEILNMAKEALKRIHEKKITVGDIYAKNVLFAEDGSCVKFCDIDSFIIDNEETLINYRGLQYRKHFGGVDQRCDIFLFNILTLSTLLNISEFDIIKSIKNSLINSDEKIINDILKFIGFFEENANSNEYLMDHISQKKEEFEKQLIYR